MYLLTSFSLSRLNNAEATAFFLNVQKAMTEAGATNMGIAAGLVTSYNNTLQKLVDQVYISQTSQLTATMNAADYRRTQIMKRIRLRLQMVEYSDDNTALKACKENVETHLLTKYTADVSRLALQQKTAVISGFLYDLSNKLTEDDIDALQIDEDIAALTQANADFISAYNARSAERAASEGQLTSKLRSEMGEYYQIISFTVQLAANDTAEANATKAAACQEFIGVVNVILADAKKRFLQRTSKDTTATDGGNTPNGGETPSGDNSNPSGGNETPSGGTTPNGGDSNPSGGNETPSGGTTPSGGDSNPSGENGNENPGGGNVDIDDEVVFPGA